jgi:hypothetical protein
MAITWRAGVGYEPTPDRGTGGRIPRPFGPVPTPDVELVNEFADDFGGMYDSPDGPDWAIVAGAAIVGTGFVLALGALCIIGAVAVARWLGWA